jgi:tetratricopeptide (TPR) repeat protein
MPSRSSFLRLKGEINHCSGNMIQAEKEYLNLLETDQRISGRERLGDIYLLLGKFEQAKEQYKQGITLAEKKGDLRKKSSLHLKLAYLLSRLKEYEAALKEVSDSCKEADKEYYPELERNALFYEGLIYTEKKSLEEAQKGSEELRILIEKVPNKKMMRNYFYLIGRIELEKKNYPKAIENQRKVVASLPFQNWYGERHALFMDSLASAYHESGDLDRAREEYEKIARLTIGMIDYGDIYAKAFYMLGKIHEEQGDEDKAIENYEKFLDLWKDADPGISEVEDARQRLAGLKNQ